MGSALVWVLHYETSSFRAAPYLSQVVASLHMTAWSELLLYMIRYLGSTADRFEV